MSDPIYGIIERLALIEGKTTPVSVKHGLNKQQQGVPQLPALLKPKNISPTLSKKPYQAHPLDGYMVGETVLNPQDPKADLMAKRKALQDLEREPGHDKEAIRQRKLDLDKEARQKGLSEAMQEVEEDMVSKVKQRFADYLEQLEQDNELDHRLVNKAKRDLDIINDPAPENEEQEMEEATWDSDVAPPSDPADTEVAHGLENDIATAVSQPTAPLGESPVKVYEMDDGTCLECWGDDTTGYEVRNGERSLPTRFPNIDHADMAVKLFQKRRQAAQQDQNQDYIEEK